MAATHGTITCKKYYVCEPLKRGFRDHFVEAAQQHVFRELQVDDEEDQSAGFCVFERPFDLDIRHDNAYFNSFLNLGFRVDRWRIPQALFKAHYRKAEQAYKDKSGVEQLSRRQKDDIKALLTRKLRRKTLPAMRIYDMSWDLDNGVLRLWNASSAIEEVFEETFEKTFGHTLMKDCVYVSCAQRGVSEPDLERMLRLEPAAFSA